MNCVNGRGFMFDCPEGLAFSQETYRCEWPDMVSDCDAEAFVGFTCPAEAQTDTVTHFNFHRSAEDCQVYYICLEGRPRMYRCKEGKLFDSLTNTCEAAENVTTCSNPGSFRAAVPIQYNQPRQVPTPAPVVVQQQQFRHQQPTQKPFQFTQFAATTAPKAQFNSFATFQQPAQVAPQQQTFQSFAQPKAFNSIPAAPQPTQDPYSFVQPRFGSGVEAPSVQPQFSTFTARTTQPESTLPETRTQLGGNAGSFNFRSTGRGSKRY